MTSENPVPETDDIYDEIHAAAQQALMAVGLSAETASSHAVIFCGKLRQLLAGDTLYFPHSSRKERLEKEKIVLDTYNGGNIKEVMQKTSLSRATIYRILSNKGHK